MILVGADFWTPLHELMKKELLGRDTIGPDDLNLYTITDDVDMIINLIKKVPIRNGLAFNHSEFEKSGIEIIPSGQNTF
jgi:predicted Rossmann-fold nucleotide-binding protein